MLAFTVASATQDIAIDAHTIAMLEKGEEGAANGIRVAAWRVAYIGSGGLLLALAGRAGWMPMYLIGAAFLLLMAPIILRAPRAELAASERRLVFRPLLHWLSRPALDPDAGVHPPLQAGRPGDQPDARSLLARLRDDAG